MNTITLVGNLTSDPEIRYTSSGKAVAKITVASDRSRAKDSKTDFIPVEFWEQLAESVNANFKKGSFVRVTGTLHLDEYEAQDGSKRRSATVVGRKIEPITAAAAAEDEAPI